MCKVEKASLEEQTKRKWLAANSLQREIDELTTHLMNK